MANKNVAIAKPSVEWKPRLFFSKYRLKNAITRFYFLPTVEYIHRHGDDYHSMVVWDSWKLVVKFMFFGIGFSMTREVY